MTGSGKVEPSDTSLLPFLFVSWWWPATGNMSEFWLISAPGDKENLQALERMNTVTSKSNLSYNTKFAIPDFKVKFLGRRKEVMDWLGRGQSLLSPGNGL